MPQLRVTFRNPVVVDTEKLGELLAATNYPAVNVEPVTDDAAPVVKTRKPRGPNKPKEVVLVTPPTEPEQRPDLLGGKTGFDKIEEAKQQQAVIEGEATVVKEPEATTPKARRGRKTATPTASTATPSTTPTAAPSTTGSNKGSEELMGRFAALVEKDYDAGVALLGKFGVGKFSDITPDKLPAFAAALDEAGV